MKQKQTYTAGIVDTYTRKFRLARSQKNAFTAGLCVLLFLVALAVTWQLKITGISLAGDENISDASADIEIATQWEATLPPRGDDWKANVAAIALSQVGYAESTKNFIMSDDEETRKGYTRFGAWFGSAYNDWDAAFASFCLEYAGVKSDQFPHFIGAYPWLVELKKAQLFGDPHTYTPHEGDLIFFDVNNDQRADSVGVVVETDKVEGLVVVQGDVDDCVQKKVVDPADISVMGYGVVPQNPALTASAEQAQDEQGAQEASGEQPASSKEPAESNGVPSPEENTLPISPEASLEHAEVAAAEPSLSPVVPTTSVVVRAEWEDSQPGADVVTVHLIAQDDIDNPLGVMTLSADSDWEGVFRNLAVYDDEGTLIEYGVVEDVVTGYDSTCDVSAIPAKAVPEVSSAFSPAKRSSAQQKTFAAPLAADSSVAESENALVESDKAVVPATLLVLSHTRAASGGYELLPAAAPSIVVDIAKEWSDGADAHINDNVTLRLTAGGQQQVITLNAQNNWQTEVAVDTSDVTLEEDPIDGYDTTITKNEALSECWVPVNAIEEGETYAIVYNTNRALSEGSSNYLSASTVNVSTGPLVVEGVSYPRYLTSVPEAAQWTWSSTASLGYTGYYWLKNVSTGNYVRKPSGSNYFVTDPENLVPLVYTSTGLLQTAGYNYMYQSGVATSYSSYATAYTLYKKVNYTENINFDVVNRKAAAQTESSTDISVKKEWQGGNAGHDPVTIHLYGEDGEEVKGCSPVTLSEENNWEIQGGAIFLRAPIPFVKKLLRGMILLRWEIKQEEPFGFLLIISKIVAYMPLLMRMMLPFRPTRVVAMVSIITIRHP